jgi:hypothetical protein
MMSTEINSSSGAPQNYQITIEGKLDPTWADCLGGLQICSRKEADGMEITILNGTVKDQAALRGILNQLWDLNLVLHCVEQVRPITQSTNEEMTNECK